jgi:hypothetical protein
MSEDIKKGYGKFMIEIYAEVEYGPGCSTLSSGT